MKFPALLRSAFALMLLVGCAGGETISEVSQDDTAIGRDTGRPDADTGTADTEVAADTAQDTTTDISEDTGADASGAVACTPATAAAACGDPDACFNGFCCNVACDQGCARCDLPGKEGICTPVTAGTVCREASNLCDAAEVCDGLTAACPENRFASAGASCGSTESTLCDAPDTCDGFGNCDANYEAFDTPCGGGDGACLLGERCDGFGACRSAGQAAPGTPCGDSGASACDAPDTCSSDGACLPNFAADTVACGDNASSACDAPDLCNGLGQCDARHVSSGTACGDPSSSACDAPDTCDGEGNCAANPRPAFTACGDATNTTCNRRDSCDGNGVCLPRITPAGVACGSTVSTACNAPDVCDGAGSCSAELAPVGSACGSTESTACNAPDSCDAFGRCVANFAPTTSVCRPAASDCDVADFCDGRGGCGADALRPEGFACGDQASTECDAPDTCDAGGRCQSNPVAAGTTCVIASSPCEGAGFCDGGGSCGGGPLLPPGTLCGSSNVSECDNADTCDPFGDCQPNHRIAGSACGALATGPCDGGDICDSAGQCSPNFAAAGSACGSSSATSCDDPDSCDGAGVCNARPKEATVVCRDAASTCDVAERCDGAGACPSDGFAAAGTACGDPTDTACTDPDLCDGAGGCTSQDAADGTACGAATTAFRCEGAGCGARAQQQVTTPTCAAGICTPLSGSWSDLEVCGTDASCTVDGTSAYCDRCDTPPPSRCDGNRAVNYAAVGACGIAGCTYAESATDCGGACAVTGGVATCTGCGTAFTAVAGAPFWSFESDTTGWLLDTNWGRRARYASNGSWSLSYPASGDYTDNVTNARARWGTDVNASLCGSCPVKVSFTLSGFAEDGYDFLTVECRPVAGTWNVLTSTSGSSSYTATWSGSTETYDLPASCLTSTMRFGFNFNSDVSFTGEGYSVDSVKVTTTPTVPRGYLDSATATGFGGWSCDPDSWSTPLQILIAYFPNGTGAPIYRTVTADQTRTDLVTAGVCGGTAAHGYSYNHDPAVLAALGAGTHTVRAYGIDATSCGGLPYELASSPKTFTR